MLHYGYAKRTEYLKWKIAWFGAGRKFRGEQRSFFYQRIFQKISAGIPKFTIKTGR